jgi:hypothetical protein
VEGSRTIQGWTYMGTTHDAQNIAIRSMYVLLDCSYNLQIRGGRPWANGCSFRMPLSDPEALDLPDISYTTILDAI